MQTSEQFFRSSARQTEPLLPPKKKSEFILDCEQGSNKVKKADPLRTQEERHAAIREKREKRKEEQAKKLALQEKPRLNAIAKRQEAYERSKEMRRRPSQQPT